GIRDLIVTGVQTCALPICADRGNAKIFTCSYHGWSYTCDGKLALIPMAEAFKDLDREKWGLIPVGKLDSYKGLLFATFDADTPRSEERRVGKECRGWEAGE